MYTSLALFLFVGVSLHNAVATKYVPVGCFKDKMKQPRPLPELIKNFRGHLDWKNLNNTIDACAREAENRGYLYFGLQFYGECWSGPRAHLTYYLDGPSKNCMSHVGKQRANFVYMLSGKENECINYRILDTKDRSTTHHTSVNRMYCDHWNFGFAAKRWYRFTGKAGQAMADKCVQPMRCQTLMSGWMDGKHPEVVDGIQSRRACFSWINNCCARSTQLRVRNCGKFYVYHLPSTPGCFLRYCGNGNDYVILKCPCHTHTGLRGPKKPTSLVGCAQTLQRPTYYATHLH